MKNFLIAVVLAIILINCFGSIMTDWLGVHLMMSDELLGPWETLATLSAIGIVLVAVGFIVAISVLGTIVLIVGAVFLALFVAGVGAFWPIIVVAIMIYVFKDRRAHQRKAHHQFAK